jgi:hypothetical protein
MKTRPSKFFTATLSAGLALILQSTVASGALITITDFVTGTGATFTPPSSLIQGITVSGTMGVPIAGGGGGFAGWEQMNDGVIDSAVTAPQTLLLDGMPNSWAVWELDTSVNTLGYDITSFQSFAGWSDQRYWQGIEIKYALVGETVLPNVELAHTLGGGPFVFQPLVVGEAPVPGATKLSIEDAIFGATILSGVSAIEVVYASNGYPGTVNPAPVPGANLTGYHEFSVVGTATVPEPFAISLVSASLGILLLRRRIRR